MSGELSGNDSLEGIMDRLAESSLDGYGNWILNRLLETTREIESQFERFEMHQLTHSLHRFFWGDFCDWYVEAAKAMLQSKDDPRHGVALAVSDLVIRQALQLLHPVMPFITEELWQAMGFGEEGSFLQDTRLPKAAELSEALASRGVVICEAGAQRIQEVNGLISQARGIKAEYNVASKRDVTLFISPADDSSRSIVAANMDTIKKLAGAATIDLRDKVENLPGAVSALGTVYLDLSSAIDVEAEKERLGKELEKLGKAIQAGEGKLNNASFVEKAPPAVVEGARKQLSETKAKRQEITRLLESL